MIGHSFLSSWSFLTNLLTAYIQPLLYDVHQRVCALNLPLRQSDYMDVLLCVYSDEASVSLVQQVVGLFTVYFVE